MDQRSNRPSPLERGPLRIGVAAAVIVAVAAAAIALTRGGGSGDTTSVAGLTQTPGAVPSQVATGPLDGRAPVIGEPAPDFALFTADGELRKLSDLRGKVVFVNFWATWCVPCKKELPDIQALLDEKESAGLAVLSVNEKDDIDAATAFFEARGVKLPMLLDASGSVYEQYRLQGLPDSFFVARDGTLAAVGFGYLTQDKMRERLAQAGLP